ncbi:MAG: class I SAM-dependent methyltransferase [Candidatus Atribacteria bacterium]
MKTSSGKDDRRLYGDLAWTWPIISPVEDYIEETELFSKLIREHSKIKVKTLLHLGCGGGHNDYTFKKHFKITSVDISEDMLRLAKKLNPKVTYHQGDMRTIRLGERFDAVTILDSINYIRTVEDLQRTFITTYEHLKPGGVFLTFVEQIAGQFKQNDTKYSTHSQGNVEITFIENYYDPDPNDISYEVTFIYLIHIGGELEIHTDRHLCGIFKLKTWHELLKAIGFEVKQMKFTNSTFVEGESYPMLICIKPLSSGAGLHI